MQWTGGESRLRAQKRGGPVAGKMAEATESLFTASRRRRCPSGRSGLSLWGTSLQRSPSLLAQTVESLPAGPHTPVFAPGGSHGQRGPAGCSPRGHQESDTTE